MRHSSSVLLAAACLATFANASFTYAGGTGANMLLIVNPNDENALRLTNAYAAVRNIPANNIIYLAPPSQFGYTNIQITENGKYGPTQWTDYYVKVLPGIIAQRGLSNQIDYIATVGQPTLLNYLDPNNAHPDPVHSTYTSVSLSMGYALSNLTQFQNGMTPTTAAYNGSRYGEVANFHTLQSLPYDPVNNVGTPFVYTQGTNTALYHSTVYSDNTQFYLAGSVGYYGRNANITVQQIINNLSYTVAGDGTKPVGTIYFEDNGDSRATGRFHSGSGTTNADIQAYMTAHNIPWVQEMNTPGYAPRNRTDVRGALLANPNPTVPNGSTYLPGSLADNLTSDPSTYTIADQTKTGKFIIAGAAATYGNAIAEPPAWVAASAHIFLNDGSTIGEAIYKSAYQPFGGLVQGDMLSQAYADVPKVTLGSVPANNTPVSGSLSFSATASLTSPTLATGIASLQLYVDGKPNGTPVSAATGSFTLNTASLADGLHELRVVATNDAAAASQGYTLSNILVNNKGESVATTGTSFAAAWNQQLQIPVTALPGTGGSIARIDLRCLGRTVAQLPAAAGNLALDATKLAFGDNTLTPVAVFADNSEVAGLPLTVTRAFNKLAGQPVTPVALQNPGFQYDYWTGHAGKTLATTDFTGTPDYTLHGTSVLQIAPNQNTSNPDPISSGRNIPDAYRNLTGGSNGGLAARITASFQATTEGEYGFSFNPSQCRWTSLQLLIDGTAITSYDTWVSGTTFNDQGLAGGIVDTNRMVYLMPGEHTLTFNLANYVAQTGSGNPSYGDFLFSALSFLTLTYPDGTAKIADASMLYTVPVPEPATLLLLPLGLLTLTARRPRRPVVSSRSGTA